MCGCADKALKARFFGYQVENSGTLDRYARAGSIEGKALYTPTNPLAFTPELGFNGVRYALDVKATAPVFAPARYGGILPIGQQPKVELPQPYERRTVI